MRTVMLTGAAGNLGRAVASAFAALAPWATISIAAAKAATPTTSVATIPITSAPLVERSPAFSAAVTVAFGAFFATFMAVFGWLEQRSP